MFKLSEKSKRRMEGIDPRLIEIADKAIEITRVDFGIPGDGGLRTAARQNELFKAGKSQRDGYRKESNHQTGKALDFYAYVNGKASWNEYDLAMVGASFLCAACILGYKLYWGGLWKFKDMPHVELVED